MSEFQDKLRQPYSPQLWGGLLPHLLPGRVELFSQAVDFPLTAENQRAIATGFRQFGRAVIPDGQGGQKILAVFEVDVAPRVDLLRNRVALRQLVARCIDEVSAHAVLAFFVQSGSKPYRLTYATRESVLNTETLSIETRETATRRYTYVLGPGETRRTAAMRLNSLIENRENAALDDVSEAFSVEKLNEEFFDTYKAHYQSFCSHLIDGDAPARVFGIKLKGLDEKNHDKALKPVRDFVKKLLGRLVFLHFLQKKGWLGCPADATNWKNGDPDFLGKLFRECSAREQERFHSRRLVPLFFDTLNRERKGDIFPITGSRVPYLNGGLFEKDFDGVDEIDFPVHLFDNLLEFFGQYNFTIDENDPDEHEIGIDPEMLGHIFENLLEDNKDKGAYYTPKAVVRYMCQQSLIHALAGHFPGDGAARVGIETLIRKKEPIDPLKETWLSAHATELEKILDDLHICDPAIGSGAFPIGLLQEIFWTKLTLHPALKRAHTKRTIIQHSIHGVDSDPGAVEIARLRFWLALIVDEHEPLPLPNLDYQIMQGDSLLESFEKLDLSKISEPQTVGVTLLGSDQSELSFSANQIEIVDVSPIRGDLAALQQKYFILHDPEAKAQLRHRIDHLVLRAIDEDLERRHEQLEAALENWHHELARKKKAKKDYEPSPKELKARERMEVEIEELAVKKRKLHLLLENPRAPRPFFLWHLWFKHIISQPPHGRGGFDIVIQNPPYISAIEHIRAYGEEFREELKKNFNTASGAWDLYVLFFEKSLSILRERGVACLINPNKYLAAPYGNSLRPFLLEHAWLKELVDVSCIRAFRQVQVYPVISFFEKIPQDKLPVVVWSPRIRKEQDFSISNFQPKIVPPEFLKILPDYLWGFLLSEHFPILKDILKRTRPLSDFGEVNATSTAAEADVFGKYFEENNKASWRIINTGTIDRFVSLWGVKQMTHGGKRYLHPILPRSSPVGENRSKLYSSPKIIFAKMASVCEAVLDSKGEYASVNTNCFHSPIDGYNLEYFVGIFNSKPFMFLYEIYFGALRMAGGDFQWQAPQLRTVPIPEAKPEQQLPIVSVTNLIISILHFFTRHPEAKTARDELLISFLEALNDVLISQLYFPEQFRAKKLDAAKLVVEARLPNPEKIPDAKAMDAVRAALEAAYDIKHPLRAVVYDFGSMELAATEAAK